MKTSTILVLTLSLCIITGPTAAGPSCDVNTDEAFNILDIVQMVTAILGDDELLCAGPGCDICPDITSDNDASYDAGYAESCLDAGLTLDCAGVCGGDAVIDCAGVCGGGGVVDDCGICGGDGSLCDFCDGVPNSGTVVDECGVCGGDGSNCAPDHVIHMPSVPPQRHANAATR